MDTLWDNEFEDTEVLVCSPKEYYKIMGMKRPLYLKTALLSVYLKEVLYKINYSESYLLLLILNRLFPDVPSPFHQTSKYWQRFNANQKRPLVIIFSFISGRFPDMPYDYKDKKKEKNNINSESDENLLLCSEEFKYFQESNIIHEDHRPNLYWSVSEEDGVVDLSLTGSES